MPGRNILLGYGYQTIHGRGTRAVFNVKKEDVVEQQFDPKFSYEADFIENGEELQKKLNLSLGLSATVYNVGAELQANYEKTIENNNYLRYYVIHMEREKYYEKLNSNINVRDMLNIFNKNSLENPGSFHIHYGDGFISEVVYGEKLVVVVEIKKSAINKVIKWDNSAKIQGPVASNVSIGASANVNGLLASLSDSAIADIKIYSLGKDAEKFELQVLKNLSDLREVLFHFIDAKGIQHPQPGERNEPAGAGTLNGNVKKEQSAIIKFTRTSYLDFLERESVEKYKDIKKNISRAGEYIKALSACRTRVVHYINNVRYLRNNSNIYNLNSQEEEKLGYLKQALVRYLQNMDECFYGVTNSLFAPRIVTIQLWKWDINYSKFVLEDYNLTWPSLWAFIYNIGFELDRIDPNHEAVRFIGGRLLVAVGAQPQPIPEELSGIVDELERPLIKFMDSAYLLTSLESFYERGLWSYLFRRHGRSIVEYTNMVVPYEAEKLLFKVQDKEGITTKGLKFNLIRKHAIHINGRNHSHHTLYKNLQNGSIRDHLFLDMDILLTLPADKQAPVDYRRAFNNPYNRKVYQQIAIATPYYESQSDRDGNPIEKNSKFKVWVYARTASALEPLNLPESPPTGKINLNDTDVEREVLRKADFPPFQMAAGALMSLGIKKKSKQGKSHSENMKKFTEALDTKGLSEALLACGKNIEAWEALLKTPKYAKEAAEELIARIRNKNFEPHVTVEAWEALLKTHKYAKEAAKELIQWTQAENIELYVRRNAWEALLKIPKYANQAAEVLIEWAQDENLKHHAPLNIEAWEDLLKNPEYAARAAEVLITRLQEDDFVEPVWGWEVLLKNPEYVDKAADGLIALAESKNSSPPSRKDAWEALLKIPEYANQAADGLIKLAQDEDIYPHTRRGALEAALKIPEYVDQAAHELIELAQDEDIDPYVRKDAWVALLKVPKYVTQAADELIALAKDKNLPSSLPRKALAALLVIPEYANQAREALAALQPLGTTSSCSSEKNSTFGPGADPSVDIHLDRDSFLEQKGSPRMLTQFQSTVKYESKPEGDNAEKTEERKISSLTEN